MLIINRIMEALTNVAAGVKVVDVRLGLRYVGVQLSGGNCGVAYRFPGNAPCDDISFLQDNGITGRSAEELLSWLGSENLLQRSIGLATANALITSRDMAVIKGDILSNLELRSDDRIVIVGYFEPLVRQLSDRFVLKIYEINASPASDVQDSTLAPEGLQRCDVALITGTAIINDTIDELLQASAECREVVILGPSTPLLLQAFTDTPVTMLSGVIVIDDEILRVVSEGGGMQQFKRFVRKVNCRLN